MNGLVSIHGDVKRMLEDAILYTLCREMPSSTRSGHTVSNSL